MIRTKRLAWVTGSSSSRDAREKSKPKFGLICLGRAISTTRKWLSLPAGSWPNWNRKRRNETEQRQAFATLCYRLLCFAICRLAIALLLRSDSGLHVPLAAPGRPKLVADRDGGSALAGDQGHDGPDGHRVQRGGADWIAHWVAHGH